MHLVRLRAVMFVGEMAILQGTVQTGTGGTETMEDPVMKGRGVPLVLDIEIGGGVAEAEAVPPVTTIARVNKYLHQTVRE